MTKLFQSSVVVVLLGAFALSVLPSRTAGASAPASPLSGTIDDAPRAAQSAGASVTLTPDYNSQSPLPISGKAMYYSPGVMDKVLNFRYRHNQITNCPECIGYVALLRAGDIDRRVWLQRPGHAVEGPYHVVDVAATHDIPSLFRRGWAVDVGWETAARWNMKNPIPITVLAHPSQGSPASQMELTAPSYTEQMAAGITTDAPIDESVEAPAPEAVEPVAEVPTATPAPQPTAAPAPVVEAPVAEQPAPEQPVVAQEQPVQALADRSPAEAGDEGEVAPLEPITSLRLENGELEVIQPDSAPPLPEASPSIDMPVEAVSSGSLLELTTLPLMWQASPLPANNFRNLDATAFVSMPPVLPTGMAISGVGN